MSLQLNAALNVCQLVHFMSALFLFIYLFLASVIRAITLSIVEIVLPNLCIFAFTFKFYKTKYIIDTSFGMYPFQFSRDYVQSNDHNILKIKQEPQAYLTVQRFK